MCLVCLVIFTSVDFGYKLYMCMHVHDKRFEAVPGGCHCRMRGGDQGHIERADLVLLQAS